MLHGHKPFFGINGYFINEPGVKNPIRSGFMTVVFAGGGGHDEERNKNNEQTMNETGMDWFLRLHVAAENAFEQKGLQRKYCDDNNSKSQEVNKKPYGVCR